MTKQRLMFTVVCILAALQSQWSAQTQDLHQTLLVRPDGRVWHWTGGETALRSVPGLTDVVAAGVLGNQMLVARADGETWLARLEDGDASPLPDACAAPG